MMVFASLAFALLANSPARADLYDGACFNEVNLLCPARSQGATLRCLKEHEDDLMTDCRRALSMLREKEAQEREAAAAEALKNPVVPLPPAPVLRKAWLFGAVGDVFVHLAGRPEYQVVAASSGMPLAEGDSIVVGDTGTAELSLDGESLIAVSSGTDLALTSLSRVETELGLSVGEISAKIEKLAEGENMRVRTPSAVAAVRGTELLVAQDSADGPTVVGVVDEGRVEVDSGGQAVLLGPHQETSATAGRSPELPRPLAFFRARAEAFAPLRKRIDVARRARRPELAERDRFAGRPTRPRSGIVRARAAAPRRPPNRH